VRSRDDQRDRPVRSERDLRDRAAQLRADELRHTGHTFSRHVDVGPTQTEQRARQTFADRNGRDRHGVAYATRWTSDRALARAVDGVERSRAHRTKIADGEAALQRGEPPATIRPVVRVPLREALGSAWRSEVAGHQADARGARPVRFADDAEVVAVYRARPGGGWRLHTCYPVPSVRGGQTGPTR
jgi:hypothetical protein